VARVFISYASKDLALAQEVRRWLVEAGHEVFLGHDPRDGIAVGEQWRFRLNERLRWADAVICVVTSAALASTCVRPRSRLLCCVAAGCYRFVRSRSSLIRCRPRSSTLS
jgi:hypothetical protein